LTAPDANMALEGTVGDNKSNNFGTLEGKAKGIYDMVKDRGTYNWLPSKLPNGKYYEKISLASEVSIT